jgi:hypothetical protein
MIKLMAKESIFHILGQNMKGNGLTINKMVKVKNIGLMKQFILDNIRMGKNMEKENLCGPMIAHIKVTFLKIISMEMENINGKMDVYIKVNGKTIKCKAKVHLLGQMEENI